MIRGDIEIPARYFIDAGRFNYYDRGERVPVWIDERTTDGSYRCQPVNGGEPIGSPVFVSGKVLYRDND